MIPTDPLVLFVVLFVVFLPVPLRSDDLRRPTPQQRIPLRDLRDRS